MKIGIIYTSVDVGNYGGFTFMNEILNSLLDFSEGNNHSFVILTDSKKIQKQKINNQNIEIVYFPYFQSGISNKIIVELPQLIRLILHKLRHPLSDSDLGSARSSFLEKQMKRHGVDMAWFLRPNQCVENIPYIITVWDLAHRIHPYFPEVSVKEIWNYREKYYAKSLVKASYVIVGTEAGKEEVQRFYNVCAERIKVLPLPTPKFNFAGQNNDPNAVLLRYGLKPGFLFYPAQLWPHKNHAGLLKALACLNKNHGLSFDLVLVGSDQGNLKHIQALAEKLNLSGQVHYLGFVPTEDLIALYKGAFVLTYPSYFGPDNIPPLEAFALGCPVIASRVSGAEEQYGNAAMLFDPGNSEQLADTVKMLHDHPDLRDELIRKGHKRALAFSGIDYIEGIFKILDEFEQIRCCWH